MSIKVTKMHGCGNDFIILDYKEYQKAGLSMPELAKKLCERHFGIGADGLIIPNTNTEEADIGWFFYNSDGTTAQMCGNGMRCFAKYVFERGLVNQSTFSVKTFAGIIKPQILNDGRIRVNMSTPVLESEKIPFVPQNNLNYHVCVKDKFFEGSAISMGNPHFVIYVKEEESLLELVKEYGPEIETLCEFPEKTNVEFVKRISSDKIEMCVWERGCGITLACGTGACASVVAGILNGKINSPVKVQLLGGEVEVSWDGTKDDKEKDVFLIGPAEYICECVVDISK